MTQAAQIARLKITLDNTELPVMRRVEVPVDIRLDNLHLVIQIAMGWENYHFYEFRTRGNTWGLPEPGIDLAGGRHVMSAKKATLTELLNQGGAKLFKYVYDFGDDWEHTVKVEGVAGATPDAGRPRLIEAKGACPPEDVGGPWGYAEFLEAIADPAHDRHEELIEWRGPGFDPAAVDEAVIRKEFERLAKRLSPRKPRAASKQAH